jgi:hypothetical protein
MSDDMARSVGPGQWAPWIEDPDPPEEPMTPEQSKKAAEGVAKLMSDPNRKEPPFAQPLYPPPARSLEEVREGMRQHRIKVLMLEYPGMSRERAAEMVALDLPNRTSKPLPAPQRPVIPPPPAKTLDQMHEAVIQDLMRNKGLSREEAEDAAENFF